MRGLGQAITFQHVTAFPGLGARALNPVGMLMVLQVVVFTGLSAWGCSHLPRGLLWLGEVAGSSLLCHFVALCGLLIGGFALFAVIVIFVAVRRGRWWLAARITVDDRGIALTARGTRRDIQWRDVRAVEVRLLERVVRVTGAGITISFDDAWIPEDTPLEAVRELLRPRSAILRWTGAPPELPWTLRSCPLLQLVEANAPCPVGVRWRPTASFVSMFVAVTASITVFGVGVSAFFRAVDPPEQGRGCAWHERLEHATFWAEVHSWLSLVHVQRAEALVGLGRLHEAHAAATRSMEIDPQALGPLAVHADVLDLMGTTWASLPAHVSDCPDMERRTCADPVLLRRQLALLELGRHPSAGPSEPTRALLTHDAVALACAGTDIETAVGTTPRQPPKSADKAWLLACEVAGLRGEAQPDAPACASTSVRAEGAVRYRLVSALLRQCGVTTPGS